MIDELFAADNVAVWGTVFTALAFMQTLFSLCLLGREQHPALTWLLIGLCCLFGVMLIADFPYWVQWFPSYQEYANMRRLIVRGTAALAPGGFLVILLFRRLPPLKKSCRKERT